MKKKKFVKKVVWETDEINSWRMWFVALLLLTIGFPIVWIGLLIALIKEPFKRKIYFEEL